MDPRYWGIVAVLVIGTAVVTYGWLADRAATRRLIAELKHPPARAIPELSAAAPPPTYLTETEARRAATSATALSDADRAALRARIAQLEPVPAGWPASDFITDVEASWVVLDAPRVLVVNDPVETIRELLGPLERAQTDARPLVIVAPLFHDDVVATLAANHAQGKVTALPIRVPSAATRATIAAACDATGLDSADLKAGFAPTDALGELKIWVSSSTSSWLVQG